MVKVWQRNFRNFWLTPGIYNVISRVKKILYIYICIVQSMCAVLNMDVFCSSLLSFFTFHCKVFM